VRDSRFDAQLQSCCIRSDREGACAGRAPPRVVVPVIRVNRAGAGRVAGAVDPDPDATPRPRPPLGPPRIPRRVLGPPRVTPPGCSRPRPRPRYSASFMSIRSSKPTSTSADLGGGVGVRSRSLGLGVGLCHLCCSSLPTGCRTSASEVAS